LFSFNITDTPHLQPLRDSVVDKLYNETPSRGALLAPNAALRDIWPGKVSPRHRDDSALKDEEEEEDEEDFELDDDDDDDEEEEDEESSDGEGEGGECTG
jgi:hypothetical protein